MIKKRNKRDQKLKFFKFKKTNRLGLLANMFYLKCWIIFIYKIWIISIVNGERDKKIKKVLPKGEIFQI